MGYTHYWSNVTITDQLMEDVSDFITLSDTKICGPLGEGTPIISKEEIAINGDAEYNQGYESFIIENRKSDFCKTGRKPYDAVVTAILVDLILNDNGSISSDGTYEDWLNSGGIDLYSRVYDILDHDEVIKIKRMLGETLPEETERKLQKHGWAVEYPAKREVILIDDFGHEYTIPLHTMGEFLKKEAERLTNGGLCPEDPEVQQLIADLVPETKAEEKKKEQKKETKAPILDKRDEDIIEMSLVVAPFLKQVEDSRTIISAIPGWVDEFEEKFQKIDWNDTTFDYYEEIERFVKGKVGE